MTGSTPSRSVSLMWLMDGIAEVPPTTARVSDLTLDSREVRPGSLFFALAGAHAHGLNYARDAVRQGASVILWEPAAGLELPAFEPSVCAVAVPGLSRLVGRIADRFFDWPSSQLRIVGITGTNGKTTCAHVLAECLGHLGEQAAYLGTLGSGKVGALQAGTHTTPDAVSIHRQFAQLRADGARTVAVEISSHALAQERIGGVHFDCAAFTNLTRDHLDYHGTMNAYGAAKARLFERLDLRKAVINVGDAFGRELAQRIAGRLPLTAVWVGEGNAGWLGEDSLSARAVVASLDGLLLELGGSLGHGQARARLIGRFNAENMLIVLALMLALGIELSDAVAALAKAGAPPGRMVLVNGGRDRALAVIDYAHTPDALAKVLVAVREHCRGSVWCVFGCGGDRDAGKRPMMGAVAAELADEIILTDDNPRSENPEAITRAISSGIPAKRVRVIHDRAQAIRTALQAAQSGDIVLIAGKGHEDYQIYGAERRAFSDRREIEQYFGAAA